MPSVIAVLTDATCGPACWEAREDVCHCSCNGKNHGTLKVKNDRGEYVGERPPRTAKIVGHRYQLAAIGETKDLLPQADKINQKFGWRHILHETYKSSGSHYVYHVAYDVKYAGSPALIKWASKDQIERWDELINYKIQYVQTGHYPSVRLLWLLVDTDNFNQKYCEGDCQECVKAGMTDCKECSDHKMKWILGIDPKFTTNICQNPDCGKEYKVAREYADTTKSCSTECGIILTAKGQSDL